MEGSALPDMNEFQPDRSDDYTDSINDRVEAETPRDEMMESMLERAKHHLDSKSSHGVLTQYCREHRLPSQFSFENLCELVRCILGRTAIDDLPIQKEECVSWIATCIFEDLPSHERAERLWDSIIDRIQDEND